MLRAQIVVVDARWLDHHQPLLAINSRSISKRIEDKPTLHKFKVGIEDGGAEKFL